MRTQVSKGEPRSDLDPAPSGRGLGLAAIAALVACALLVLVAIRFADRPVHPRTDANRDKSSGPAWTDLFGDARQRGTAGPATPGRRLAEDLVLAPHMIEGRLAGYVVTATSGAAAVSAAGLRPGDVLIDLDGRPLEPARIDGLADELSLADSLEVTYQRDGHIRRRIIDLTR
jgi:hypothetical protein